MTTPVPAVSSAGPAPAQRLERAAAALTAHGFTAEISDDAAAARTRVQDLIPEGASVFTGASETLRLPGIDADINASERYRAVKPRVRAMDRVTSADDIRRLLASPDVAVGSSPRSPRPAPWWPPRPAAASYPATPAVPPAGPGSSERGKWPRPARLVEDHCLPLESAAPRRLTGNPAPSTTC
jgi:hypothetical protein